MKIYTKTGDAGQTSLLGGSRVSKGELQIEAYGTVDELNAYIGLLRDLITNAAVAGELLEIQDRLFTIGSLLANDHTKNALKLPSIIDEDISRLENEIDAMNETLPPMTAFVLPGGHPTVSHSHVARCICRRAERYVVRFAADVEVDHLLLKYLNRLSDYLFVLSRKLTADLNADEQLWKPRK